MKYALVFPDHRGIPKGPMAKSLFALAEARNIDKLFLTTSHNWDDYDILLCFWNRWPRIEASRAKVGWWLCDLRSPAAVLGHATPPGMPRGRPNRADECAEKIDHIFLCNKLFLEDFSDLYGSAVHYMPQCGNDIPVSTSGRRLAGDIVFIGAVPGIKRRQTLVELERSASSFPCLLDEDGNFEVVSKDDVVKGEFHKNRLSTLLHLQKHAKIDLIHTEGTTVDAKWVYQNAPISLALSPPVSGYTSNRLYNILSSKGFCLTLWFPGIEELFENHKHLVWFKTPEEATELVKHYLARPEARQKIKEYGHEEYLSNHTAACRVDAMLAIMEQSLASEKSLKASKRRMPILFAPEKASIEIKAAVVNESIEVIRKDIPVSTNGRPGTWGPRPKDPTKPGNRRYGKK